MGLPWKCIFPRKFPRKLLFSQENMIFSWKFSRKNALPRKFYKRFPQKWVDFLGNFLRNLLGNLPLRAFLLCTSFQAFLMKLDCLYHSITLGEKSRFLCTLCGKHLATAQALKKHIMHHMGQRPFSCMYCEKTYVVKSRLDIHLMTHSGGYTWVASSEKVLKFYGTSHCHTKRRIGVLLLVRHRILNK